MIPIRFDSEHEDRGIGAVMVMDGYGAYTGDAVWVRPSALKILEELGIPYHRLDGEIADAQKKTRRKKKSVHLR